MSAGAFVHKNVDSFNPSTLTENERKRPTSLSGLGLIEEDCNNMPKWCTPLGGRRSKDNSSRGDLHTAIKLHSIPDCKFTKTQLIMDLYIGIQAEILAHTNSDTVWSYCIIVIMTKYRTDGFFSFIFTTHYVSSAQSAGCILAHGYVGSFSSML